MKTILLALRCTRRTYLPAPASAARSGVPRSTRRSPPLGSRAADRTRLCGNQPQRNRQGLQFPSQVATRRRPCLCRQPCCDIQRSLTAIPRYQGRRSTVPCKNLLDRGAEEIGRRRRPSPSFSSVHVICTRPWEGAVQVQLVTHVSFFADCFCSLSLRSSYASLSFESAGAFPKHQAPVPTKWRQRWNALTTHTKTRQRSPQLGFRLLLHRGEIIGQPSLNVAFGWDSLDR